MTLEVTITPTTDGRVLYSGANYAVGRETSTSRNSTETQSPVGQYYSGSTYSIGQVLQEFDITDAVPAGYSLTGLRYRLYAGTAVGGTLLASTIEVRAYNWGSSFSSATYLAGSLMGAQRLIASMDSTAYAAAAWNEFTVADNAVLYLPSDGMLQVCIASSNQRLGNAPGSGEHDFFNWQSMEGANPPQLILQCELTDSLAAPVGSGLTALTPNRMPKNLAWLYTLPTEDEDAAEVKLVVLTAWQTSHLERARALAPDAKVLLYKSAVYLRSSDNANTVMGYSYVASEHPDWFMKDASGNTIWLDYYGDGDRWYFMDYGNTDWQAYWATQAISQAQDFGADGVFADDLYCQRYGSLDIDLMAPYGTDDAVFQAGARAWLAATYADLNAESLLLVPNLVEHEWYEDLWADWLTISSGLMHEHYMHAGDDATTGYTSFEDGIWYARFVQEVSDSETAGKYSIFLGDVDDWTSTSDTQYLAAMYCYASYLLGAGELALFSVNPQDLWPEAYDWDLGAPATAEIDLGGGLHQRYFTAGRVLVNSSNTDTRVIDTGGWWHADAVAGRITLAPDRAVIFRLIAETTPPGATGIIFQTKRKGSTRY